MASHSRMASMEPGSQVMTVTGFFRRILAVPLQRPRDEETENAPLTGSEKQYEPDEVHCQCCRQAGIPRVGSKAIGSRTVRNVALCCVLVLNILLFGCSYYLLNRRPAPCNDRASLWSPALEGIGDFEIVSTNNSFGSKNKWLGEPSDALDTAWQDLWMVKPGRLTEDELQRLGLGAIKPSRWPDAFGGGYVFKLEALHHMHCLDFVRKRTRMDYYFEDPAFKGVSHEILPHCIETLRNAITCYGDPTPKPFVWVDGYDVPYPYNIVTQKCRNYDNILSWAHERSQPHEAFLAMQRNDTDYSWPSPP